MRLEEMYDREIARARLARIRRARAKMYALNVLGICSVCFAVCCVISIVIGSCTAEARYAAARARGAAEALNANYGHVLSAYAIENERLKARIRELEGGEK